MTTSTVVPPVRSTGSTPGALARSAWDEPEGVAARGTLVVLTGRGETPSAYQRLGRRMSADAYRVRVVQVRLEDLDAARAEVAGLLADDSLPAPRVLVGSDAGATYAAQLAAALGPGVVDGLVLAGLALPVSRTAEESPASWEDELEARTACPTHRRVLGEDDAFTRGALAEPLPDSLDAARLGTAGVPTLVVHGSADPVTPSQDAFAPFRDVAGARLRLVVDGRHDVLNDVTHRSVAATVVLFLESLRLGSALPVVVGDVQG